MIQRNPLLQYRIKCISNKEQEITETNYDFLSGLWIDESGVPVIKKYITSECLNECEETLITKTREGIDRSEASSHNESDFLLADKTLITETREGIDRAEISFQYDEIESKNEFKMLGQTLETRTREGIDKSERASNYDNGLSETLITFTRESIDRSERS